MGSTMKRTTLVSVACALLIAVTPLTAQAQADNEARIRNAMSAAPSSIADGATILEWPAAPGAKMAVLREGSSQWTCFPAMPSTPGNDPMCVDGPWLDWMNALANRTEPNTTRMGFGYMLQENDSPYSNADPHAEGPTEKNEWQATDVPHLMILVPNDQMLAGLSHDPDNGGPWVMWRGTPYVHIMAPMPKHAAAHKE
jgi:hypothetical protein